MSDDSPRLPERIQRLAWAIFGFGFAVYLAMSLLQSVLGLAIGVLVLAVAGTIGWLVYKAKRARF